MSYHCKVHGWQHLLDPCPACGAANIKTGLTAGNPIKNYPLIYVTADEKKPREWRLPLNTLIINSCFYRVGEDIHVIEFSAYDQWRKEAEKLAKELQGRDYATFTGEECKVLVEFKKFKERMK